MRRKEQLQCQEDVRDLEGDTGQGRQRILFYMYLS